MSIKGTAATIVHNWRPIRIENILLAPTPWVCLYIDGESTYPCGVMVNRFVVRTHRGREGSLSWLVVKTILLHFLVDMEEFSQDSPNIVFSSFMKRFVAFGAKSLLEDKTAISILTESSFNRMSLPATPSNARSMLVAVPVCLLATK